MNVTQHPSRNEREFWNAQVLVGLRLPSSAKVSRAIDGFVNDHVERFARSFFPHGSSKAFELLRREILLTRHATESDVADRDALRFVQHDVQAIGQTCQILQRLQHRQRLFVEVVVAVHHYDVDIRLNKVRDEIEEQVALLFGDVLSIGNVTCDDQNLVRILAFRNLRDYRV